MLNELAQHDAKPDNLIRELQEEGLDFNTVHGYFNGNEYEPSPANPNLRRKRDVLVVRFRKLSSWSKLRKLGKELRLRPPRSGLAMCEHWLEPEQELYAEYKISPGSWLRVDGASYDSRAEEESGRRNRTTSTVEVHLRYRTDGAPVLAAGDPERPQPPIKAISFDIETATRTEKEFPLAHRPECEVASIATTTMLLGGGTGDTDRKDLLVAPRCHFFYLVPPAGEVSLAHLEAEGALEGVRGATVTGVPCANERDLLRKFAAFVRKESAQLLVGWNSFKFDNNYMIRRGHYHYGGIGQATRDMPLNEPMRANRRALTSMGQFPYFCGEPRLVGRASDASTEPTAAPGLVQLDFAWDPDTDRLMHKAPAPSAAVANPLEKIAKREDPVRYDSPGLANLDAMAFLQANGEGYETYALGKLGQLLLGASKDDLTYAQLHRIFADPTPAGLQEVAKYNIIDTVLPLRILLKLDVIAQMVSLCKVTSTNLADCLGKGQQHRLGNMYARYAREPGKVQYVLPSKPLNLPEERPELAGTYPGAFVLPPCRGRYGEPVVCLDYQSLYPSLVSHTPLEPTHILRALSLHLSATLHRQHHAPTQWSLSCDEPSRFLANPCACAQICSHNLSPEMLMRDCSPDWRPPEGMPPTFYTERVLRETEEVIIARHYRVVNSELDAEGRPTGKRLGIFPRMEMAMLDQRDAAKGNKKQWAGKAKALKAERDRQASGTEEWRALNQQFAEASSWASNYDAQQLSLKVVANSMYGGV